MSTQSISSLVDAWIEFQHTEDDGLRWVVHEIGILTDDHPTRAWEAIRTIFEKEKDDEEIVGMLAAWPLEDLLVQNGDLIIEAIKEYLTIAPEFATCLRGVWLDERDSVYQWLETIKNTVANSD